MSWPYVCDEPLRDCDREQFCREAFERDAIDADELGELIEQHLLGRPVLPACTREYIVCCTTKGHLGTTTEIGVSPEHAIERVRASLAGARKQAWEVPEPLGLPGGGPRLRALIAGEPDPQYY